ncbi:unnamed protein product [Paramecium primaurelia]|uniref:Uncharacterized protein n=1 Tax=Paramecium primaurelia TaxID=5886 RepID=A0A8S1NJL7_PARPR|nr:unnamed protein product [Paramecium primaurelia]
MYNFKKTRNQFLQSEFGHQWFRRTLKCKINDNLCKSMLQYIKNNKQRRVRFNNRNKESSQELDNFQRKHESRKQIVKDLKETQIKLQEHLNFQYELSVTLYH